MANVVHHAIVITTTSGTAAFRINEAAREVELVTTGVYASPCNDFFTLVVLPDGSGDGKPTSDEYDTRRAAFVGWLREHPSIEVEGDSTGNPVDWVEVVWGMSPARVVSEG